MTGRHLLSWLGCAVLTPAAAVLLASIFPDRPDLPARALDSIAGSILIVAFVSIPGWVLLAVIMRYGLRRVGARVTPEQVQWTHRLALVCGSLAFGGYLFHAAQDAPMFLLTALFDPYVYWSAILLGGLVGGFAGYTIGFRRAAKDAVPT